MKNTAKSCIFLRALLNASSILITDLARCRRCSLHVYNATPSQPSHTAQLRPIYHSLQRQIYIMLIFRCICTCTHCRAVAHVISAFGIAIPHHRAISVVHLALRKHILFSGISFSSDRT